MTLEKKIGNLLFYYIKNKYKEYLSNNSLKYIEDDKLYDVVSDFYNNNDKDIKIFIRESLKKMLQNYPGPIVENILLEIFSDKELAINRVINEVKLFQDCNKEELENQILNNSYEVYLTPHEEEGLGLSLNVSTDEIKVIGFKKSKNNKSLPAENCSLIKIGDRLININNENVNDLGIDKAIKLLKKVNIDNKEITLKLLNKSVI